MPSLKAVTDESDQAVRYTLDRLISAAGGREQPAKLLLCSLLSGGHILLNDHPGTGKTTLAKAVGATLGLAVSRIQGTSDLLPSDIIGVSIFDKEAASFSFKKGPVFSPVVICDEINRCSPKTQSALLEAMAERQVTVDGTTYLLPPSFSVIATQNPFDAGSAAKLPISQMDRFMMQFSMGHLPKDRVLDILAISKGPEWGDAQTQGRVNDEHSPGFGATSDFSLSRSAAQSVVISGPVLAYIYRIMENSHKITETQVGLSLRAGKSIVRASKSVAFINGRDYVVPQDVDEILCATVAHRILSPKSLHDGTAQGKVASLRELSSDRV